MFGSFHPFPLFRVGIAQALADWREAGGGARWPLLLPRASSSAVYGHLPGAAPAALAVTCSAHWGAPRPCPAPLPFWHSLLRGSWRGGGRPQGTGLHRRILAGPVVGGMDVSLEREVHRHFCTTKNDT